MEYREKTGTDFGAAPGAASAAAAGKDKKDDKRKDDKKKDEKKKDEKAVCRPPEVPVLAPVYTTPAPPQPVRVTPLSSAPAAGAGAGTGQQLDAAAEVRALEGVLAVYSYAAGYAPSKEDARLLQVAKTVDLTQLPNVSRWARQVASYTAEEVQGWQ